LLVSRVPQNGCPVPWFNNTSRSSRVSADSSARRCSGVGGERSKSYALAAVETSVGDISQTPSIRCCFVHKQKPPAMHRGRLSSVVRENDRRGARNRRSK